MLADKFFRLTLDLVVKPPPFRRIGRGQSNDPRDNQIIVRTEVIKQFGLRTVSALRVASGGKARQLLEPCGARRGIKYRSQNATILTQPRLLIVAFA
jgi:hypothetical protein